jgi:hypothetical protein
MQEVFHALNPNYTPLDRGSITDRIFQENYDVIKEKVLEDLRRSEHTNISFDESTNIVDHQIIAITINTLNNSCSIAWKTWKISS